MPHNYADLDNIKRLEKELESILFTSLSLQTMCGI